MTTSNNTLPPPNGAQRAAILLLALGENDAAEVLKFLPSHDVHAVGMAMASLGRVPRDQVEEVMDQLLKDAEQFTSLNVGNHEYIRKILVSAVGEGKADGMIDRILLGRTNKGLEALKWMDARSIAQMISGEHPQIVALVLSHLESEQAAEVLSCLPPRVSAEAVMRVATIESLQPQALDELDEIMERQFSGSAKVKRANVGGLKVAADMVNAMDANRETELMNAIREEDAELSGRIEELMFVFDDLADIDDRSMQVLLREVPSARLIVAMKGAAPAVVEKIVNNMSKRAADMLKDDLAAAGPVRVSDVDAAQKEILAIARRLDESGEINLSSDSDEMIT